ncbi:MAG: ribonuclease HII [Raineya sp.]
MMQSSFSKKYIEVGLDEVGRGCLAGSVVAAAVILPPDFTHSTLTDSKRLSEKERKELENDIKKSAWAWAIGEASVEEIDTYNILNASILAMHRALDKIFEQNSIIPELILVDGNRFKPYVPINTKNHFLPYQCVVKGDAKFYAIAAASVLAKNYRDAQMEQLAELFPQYHWHKNVGYPTTKHKEALKLYGLTEHHRKTFKPCVEVRNFLEKSR